MRTNIVVACLLVGVAQSKVTSYAIPTSLENADDCAYPSDFEISDFKVSTDLVKGSTAFATFRFVDAETGIDTSCQNNANSKSDSSGSSAQRWPCDNPIVEFIWQRNQLTLVEQACPGSR
jgi:hypothetical protein